MNVTTIPISIPLSLSHAPSLSLARTFFFETMSLLDQPLPVAGKAGRAGDTTNSRALDGQLDFSRSSQPTTAFDEPIIGKFYDMDNQDTMAPNLKRVRSSSGSVPELPARSSLRASRILDHLALKLGGAVEAAELGQATTPHDLYLSSEEDASSDADDFSDYDYDSSVEDPASPTRRTSHEDTARVVSVVYAGKPSIVDLPATRKRPLSSSSVVTDRTRSSTESSASPAAISSPETAAHRPATPASTVSSQYSRQSKEVAPNRRSLLLSEMLIKKKKPLFLSIDPYANGSTYTLDIPKALDSLEGEDQSAKTPRTPTSLLRGVTRSFSLGRKRSRPNLSSPQSAAVPRLDTSFTMDRNLIMSVQAPAAVELDGQYEHGARVQQQQQQPEQRPKTPMTPITYNDILRAVKRNATIMGASSPPSDIMSPTSPGTNPAPAKRGILSGLSARRKSIKLTARS